MPHVFRIDSNSWDRKILDDNSYERLMSDEYS